MKYFMPILMPELAMDDDFTEVLLRLNSSDDFIFILQAIILYHQNKNKGLIKGHELSMGSFNEHKN